MKLLQIFVDLQYSDHKSWMGEIKLMLFLIYVLILGSKLHIMWSGCKRDIYYILFTKWRYSEFSNFADCDSYTTKFNLEVAIRIWEPILFDTFNNKSSSECKMSFLLQNLMFLRAYSIWIQHPQRLKKRKQKKYSKSTQYTFLLPQGWDT